MQVEQRLEEEKKRVRLYLNVSTEEILLKKCEEVLVQKHLDLFYSEFENLLDDCKNDDLARMYDLVAKVPDGLIELKRLLEIYIYNQGMEAIEKCCEIAINVFYLFKFFISIFKIKLLRQKNIFLKNKGP
jgi:cullin 1